MLTHLALVLLLAGAAPDAGFDATNPATWTLAAKLGPGSKLREALIADFTADAGAANGVGEAPLSRAEAEALLDDPRAQLVYGEKTIAIVAPSMLTRQRQDHLDLMKLFLKPERLAAGAAFAKEREAALSRVEAATRVDRGVIVGILMWETKLGTITGDYLAFNAFISQAFFIDEANAIALSRKEERVKLDQAAQAKRVETIRARAKKNLLALVRQGKARGIDVFTMKGSWAGAMGYPQFMPASLRWADDGNGDGVIDLFNFDDAIASVGRYLAEHGFAKDKKKAVWDYNHEDAYVQGVLAFGEKLQAMLAPDAGTVPTAKRSPNGKPPESIGSATMKPDGTIQLMLRAEGGGGAVGDALLTYPKTHPQYAEILRHLGGLEPGQSKPVPPFPDKR
ncbi:MAG: lytic murein transglycosylase [Myxococcales bacterium]|nr:lytic murein transglycosylase [Myxococcales bacterium]